MNKRPSLQFYPADWLKDPQLQICSMNTIGIWINLLCRMWETKEEGILSGRPGELALLVGARPTEFKRFLKEVETHLFADVTECNSIVTIKSRRMNNAFLEREGAKVRMRRYRGKQGSADVTPHPSTSSSSSTSNKYSPNSDEFRLAKLLLDKIICRKSDFKKPNLQDWSQHIDRMIRLDGRIIARIAEVIRWCQQDDFWQNNILSTDKLRKQFDKLELRMVVKPETKTKTKLFPISGKTCSKQDCNMPAVYKYTPTGGSYEIYRCADHLPESVKEKYE